MMMTHKSNNLIPLEKIIKIMTVEPASEYGTLAKSFCEDAATFNFKSDSSFNYKGNPACHSRENIRGVWNLPKSDSLFITFTESWTIGAYEKLAVTKLTADTMKWNIVASTGNVFNIDGAGTANLIFRDCIVASSANVGLLKN